MNSRLITWSVASAVLLAGGIAAMKEGWLNGWKMRFGELMASPGGHYSAARFRVDLVDQFNYSRMASKTPMLRVDPEMEAWLDKEFPKIDTSNLNKVTELVQEGMPRYYRVSICSASSPSLRELLHRFHEYSHRAQPEMTHMAVALRPRASGLMHEALLVLGQRLRDFTPEALTKSSDEPFFSSCVHCKQPHFMKLSASQRSMALECPKCRRKYAVIAADSSGHFRYVNEFLTGYAPPATFAKNQSRVQQLFTIWSAVHANCRYANDPGAKAGSSFAQKEQMDCWQFADETQRLQRGDCEDSSIYLADWLMSRGFQVRVALGRYGDLGGHAWCVVKIDDKEYLIESTESRPDPNDPPLASRVGSRYVPEVLFDRFAIYVPSSPNRAWKGDYWSGNTWTRIEPRTELGGDPILARAPTPAAVVKSGGKNLLEATATADATRLARTTFASPASPAQLNLGDIPLGARVWSRSLIPPRHP
jgi:hypothetical protein